MLLQIIVVRNSNPQIDDARHDGKLRRAPSVTKELSNKSSIATDTLAMTSSATNGLYQP